MVGDEYTMASKTERPARIAIGGIGGSGTRVAASIVQDLGYCFGPELNGPLDNMWFARLFKNHQALSCSDDVFARRYDTFRSAMSVHARGVRVASAMIYKLVAAEGIGAPRPAACEDVGSAALAPDSSLHWAWKEPNTHMCIDRILNLDPGLCYIHVMRNGLDMAYSANQNQLRIWGRLALGDKFERSPRGSLRFWCWVHKRMLAIAELMPSRCKLVNFDELCRAPDDELGKLLEYLNITPTRTLVDDLAKRIKPPESVGRHAAHSRTDFDLEDIDFVGRLGFSVYATT